jgi:4-aminobutyrate aminotransferase
MHRRKHITVDPPGPIAKGIVDAINVKCYNSTFLYPLVIKDGEGCHLEDVDGNIYLDFTSCIGTAPLGYKHSAVIDTLKEYADNGAHKIAGQDFYCKEHMLLASRLLDIAPKDFKAFLINSGAEAVENAIKLAYKSMGALPGVSCINAFHGRTLGALTLTFSKPVQKNNFPELPVKRIKFCTDDDDPDIDSIEYMLKENRVAYVITEIIQGEGGYNIASRRFIKTLRESTYRYGVPLIVDEVQSGMARTGRWWAYEHYDITPDIICAAKALQVGATLYHKRFDPNQQGVLSSTWGGGDRIDMAVGLKILEVIDKDKLYDNASKIGSMLLEGLKDIMYGSVDGNMDNTVVDVRGLGLMIGVEFITKEIRDRFILQAFKNGLLLLPAGVKTVRVIPPLVIGREEVYEGLEIIEDTLRDLKEQP